MESSWKSMTYSGFLFLLGAALIIGVGVWSYTDLKSLEDYDNSHDNVFSKSFWDSITSEALAILIIISLSCVCAAASGIFAGTQHSRTALVVFMAATILYVVIRIIDIIAVGAMFGIEYISIQIWVGAALSVAVVLFCTFRAFTLYRVDGGEATTFVK